MDYDHYVNNTFNGTDLNSITSGWHIYHNYVIPSLLVLIGIGGLVGNVPLIVMMLKTKVRNMFTFFILMIAQADIMGILFYVPLRGIKSFPVSEGACQLSAGFVDLSSGMTAFSLIALIVFSFAGKPPTPQCRSAQWKAFAAMVVVWMLAVALACPTLLTARLDRKYEGEVLTVRCYSLDPTVEMWLGPLKFVAYYVAPLIAFGIYYSFARLSGNLDRQTVAQREISKMATWLFIVYAACSFMWSMNSLLIILPVVSHVFREFLDHAGAHLKLINRCLNPLVLYYTSGKFRRVYERILLCWCVKRNQQPVPDVEKDPW